MTKGREIRAFDYVNHPHDDVKRVLTADARKVFHDATKSATSRAESVAAELRATVAGIEVGTDIEIAIDAVEETARSVKTPPSTRLKLEWKASKSPRLFPLMHAELTIYPLTATETQLDLSGRYEPPLGALGNAIDAVMMHRIAEASVHRFVRDVAEYLRKNV